MILNNHKPPNKMENTRERVDTLAEESGIDQIKNDILNLLYARGVIDKKPNGEFDMDKSDYCGLVMINKKIQFKFDDCDELHSGLIGTQMIIGDDDLVAESLYQYAKETYEKPAIGKFLKKLMQDFHKSLNGLLDDL